MRDVGMTDEDFKMTGIGAFGVNARWEVKDAPVIQPSLRSLMVDLAMFQEQRGAGLLITVDEIHAGSDRDLRELATSVQHGIREGRWISFVAAGLPAAVKGLINDDVITFLRRADRHDIGHIDPLSVEKAIKIPIEEAGRSIGPKALQMAADATGGYGFMIQLVGYYLWEVATDDLIEADDVKQAVELAEHRVGSLMIEPTLDDLSPTGRRYLMAMSLDDGVSSTRDISERLSIPMKQAGVYRDRLIASGIISAPGRGIVDIEVPYLRSYMRAHPIELD